MGNSPLTRGWRLWGRWQRNRNLHRHPRSPLLPALDELAKANPAAMFTHPFMLKYGKDHMVRLFGFIGYGGSEDKSVAAVTAPREAPGGGRA